MNILNLEHVSKRYVSRPILTDVTIGIEDRDRIGVVGINGTGKSTFLSIVAGTEEPDEGQVITRSGLRISCLPQEPVFDEGKSLLDNIADRTGDREEYWDTEGRVRNMLLRLGIDDPACSPRHLSGGQKKRAVLSAREVRNEAPDGGEAGKERLFLPSEPEYDRMVREEN